MAARVLDDILNNFLPLDSLWQWLSNKNATSEENIFFNQYECSQVDFVSYFLVFLREQSSRDFQIYDAETPRKNSHSRAIKNSNTAIGISSPISKIHQNSLSANCLDFESLQSFPSLFSSSFTESYERKNFDSTKSDLTLENSNWDNSEKKIRRVKLFSEILEGNFKGNKSFKKELELLEDVELKQFNNSKFTMSTPKPFKNSSVPVDCLNTSGLQAEISPKLGSKSKKKNQSLDLSNPDISTVTHKSRSFSGDSSHGSKDHKINCRMSLGDFILSDDNNRKEKKGKTKKRINPVKVASNTGNFMSNEKTENFIDISNRCSVLDEKKNLTPKNDKSDDCCSYESISESKDSAPVKNILNSTESPAEVELATHTSELKVLSEIYAFLINENYCQNIMIELCFIISLLVIQDYNKKMSEVELKGLSFLKEKKYFSSIHNCVYFAVETLWHQRNVLLLLNLSALKLLSENTRIEKFNPNLKEFLLTAYCKRQSNEEVKRHSGLMKTSMQGNVSFQYETDNRENFTSDISFHSFRKQRDLFYNILAIWEANHLVNGWIFSICLGSKIRSLLSICSDPVNLLHLSRLFRSQMIMSCCGENQAEGDVNEDILQLLPSADPNKILRLRARLTSSPKRQGPCPLPDFTGYQEFYKDFILCTSSSTFHEHLKNSLCDEILRLNDTDLTGDAEDDDSCLDEQTVERYLQSTNILRLLAKFLGFIEFLPYRCEKPLSDRILNMHCSVRNNTLPLFDIVLCLNSSLRKKKLTLTIPWIVSYLSMIDPYSAHLKVYQNVWQILILIYKNLKSFKNFYSVLEDYNKNSIEASEISSGEEGKLGLDSYDFVEESVLYAVCPYLNEINVILSENLGCTVRHIRPVTTHENSFSKSQASKQLELRLESNFLHNQSSSTRKTVEFVTERVASIAIKHLIHDVIPKIKEDAWAQLESFPATDLKEAAARSETLSESCYQKLLTTCEKENWDISFKRSEVAVKALLSNDLQGSVATTCAKIVARQATEKVQRWMQSHVTLAMVKKEFLSITRKKFAKKPSEGSRDGVLDSSELLLASRSASLRDSQNLPSSGREVAHHDEDAWPASLALKTVRDLILKIYDEGSLAGEVEEVIEEAIKTVERRDDLIPVAEKTLLFLVVDLVVVFCVRFESDVPQDIFKKLFRLVKSVERESFPRGSLERIICPRNVTVIANAAKNKQKAWENLGSFLMSLMEGDLLTREEMETQLLSLLRQNWEKENGIQLSKFISQILARYSKNNGCDKFSLLLEYIIDTLNDDEPKSESLG